jgi:hypothetical protein
MNIGRNDPCPCNSGKKYKKCCLLNTNTQNAEDFAYRRYREIENKLTPRLFHHAVEVFGPTSIEESWDEFCCWENEEGFDPENPINQLFGPFFLFCWEIDPANTDCDIQLVEGMTVAESFLNKWRSRLSREEIEIIESANRKVFRFYEVSDVTPGQGFLLRNILTDVQYDVNEQSGSKGAQRGEILFAALFQVNGRYQTLAMSPYLLPPLAMQNLVELRNIILKRLKVKQLKDAEVSGYDAHLRSIYFELLEPLLNPQIPKLCNSDGDPLVPQTLDFEITDPENAFTALTSLTAGVVSEEELRVDSKLRDGRIHEVEIPWFKKTKAASHPGSNILLGTIRIKGTKLTAEVNSNKRASAIKKKILSILKSKVRFISKAIESIEGIIDLEAKHSQAKSSTIPLDQLPPEVLDGLKDMADAHWTKWFDEKIPALNGKTPKQAAKTKEGRELLEALLNSYEQGAGNASNNVFQPDVQHLRLKLGL